MNMVAMLVLGILIGWLVEWVIDWRYWRGHISRIANENKSLKERVTALEAQKVPEAQSAKGVPLTDKAGRDNFQAIKGIGPVFAKRLHEAGIHTFEELAQLSPQQLQEILGDLYKRFFSKQETILAQAKEFAQQKERKS